MAGGFPGFIWGWFQVPDHSSLKGLPLIIAMYSFPLLGAAATLILFLLLKRVVIKIKEATLISIFAAAAVACYYWFRIPSLIGFSVYDTDGMLVNLKGVLPLWTVYIMVACSTLFFFWWIVLRSANQQSWVIRPEYAITKADAKRNDIIFPAAKK
jgi:fatty acid desaturase